MTGKTQGDLNTVLGAIGTLGTLTGGILGRNGYYNNADPDSRVITKAEAELMQENSGLKSQLALC